TLRDWPTSSVRRVGWIGRAPPRRPNEVLKTLTRMGLLCVVWEVLTWQLSSASADVELRPGMTNVCSFREVDLVRVRRPCRRARLQMTKFRRADCLHGQADCFEVKPRTVYYTAYEDVLERRHRTSYRCCPGWERRTDEAGCWRPAYSEASQCLNGGRSRRHGSHFGETGCICPRGFQGLRCEL
ncbi:hypothetical protein HPB47_001064, partial [Ixodes persulcatus]